MKKLLMIVIGLVIAVPAIGFVAMNMKQPASRPASTEKVEVTPERMARGKYLVEGVLSCLDCHSAMQPDVYAFYPKPGTLGGGGFCFTKENNGFPGTVCGRNITSDPETGIGQWTDGEVLRAIREGVDRDGKALFPMMPYLHFRELAEEDAKSVLVFIRTLPPIKNAVPPKALDFPVSFFVKLAPRPLEAPVAAPDRKDSVAYGKYLVTIAGCESCHSPVDDHHNPIPDRMFSGGQKFDFNKEGMHVQSANITFDPTGLGDRTKEQFIGKFAAYRGVDMQTMKVDPKINTPMPLGTFRNMTDEDLGAIYDYLKTVPKHANTVPRLPLTAPPAPPTAAPTPSPEPAPAPPG